jgi:hypothetical protein
MADRVLFDVEMWNGKSVQEEQVEGVMRELADSQYGAANDRIAGNRTRHVIS